MPICPNCGEIVMNENQYCPNCRTDHVDLDSMELASRCMSIDMAKMENYCPECHRMHANPKVQL